MSESFPLVSRRNALKALAGASGAIALSTLPSSWGKPVVEAGALPAHAQASLPLIPPVPLVAGPGQIIAAGQWSNPLTAKPAGLAKAAQAPSEVRSLGVEVAIFHAAADGCPVGLPIASSFMSYGEESSLVLGQGGLADGEYSLKLTSDFITAFHSYITWSAAAPGHYWAHPCRQIGSIFFLHISLPSGTIQEVSCL